MNEETKQIIAEQLKTLPKELREAIVSIDYPQKLQEIVKNNKLMLDQAGALETETTLVLLGLEPLQDYVDNLVNNAGFSKNLAFVIAHDVNETIFKNIRESLKKINEEAAKAEIELKKGNVPENLPGVASVQTPIEEKVVTTPINELEIRPEMLPETQKDASQSTDFLKKLSETKPLHENISPVQNIVEAKTTNTIIIPKENIVIEEKTKLPPTKTNDPYREPIN